MSWNPEVKEYLRENNYCEIVNFYEQLLEENSENPLDYLYLGLAYLLIGKEEEAQTTWFLVIAESGDENLERTLIEIFAEEAERLEKSEANIPAWLIRNHWREIEPENINNLLKLILLEIELEYYHPEKIEEWGVLEIIKRTEKGEIEEELLLKSLEKLLHFPEDIIGKITAIIKTKVEDKKKVESVIAKTIVAICLKKVKPIYVPTLCNLFLEYCPEDEENGVALFWALNNNGLEEDALRIANYFAPKAKDLISDLLWKSHLFLCYHKAANWEKRASLGEEMKALLHEIIKEKLKDKYDYHDYRVGFMNIIAGYFNYLQDNPQETHYLQQEIAKLFSTLQENKDYIYPNPKHSNRKLKIGYIASTLGQHSVGLLSRWLFHHHNRDEFEIIGYCIKREKNPMTNYWFAEKCDHFYYCEYMGESVVAQIKKNEIDILVDLDSFSYNITAMVMSEKPAPIQVTWLGMDASGLPSIDYFIADPYVLPENAQEYYHEKIWRLPETYLAIDGFEIGIPTISKESLGIDTKAVIYYNVQNGWKIHPDILKLQLKIVKAVDNSYFMIKKTGIHLEDFIHSIAEEVGLAQERIIFVNKTKDEPTHRANLLVADVVLDTYPYNGATTSLETLWAGIPIVTKVGEQFSARNSYAFMINAGIREGITWNDQEYFDWGVRLGQDVKLRQEISWKLKQSRQTSPLWNAKKFTQEMEKAYREMWSIYCQNNP